MPTQIDADQVALMALQLAAMTVEPVRREDINRRVRRVRQDLAKVNAGAKRPIPISRGFSNLARACTVCVVATVVVAVGVAISVYVSRVSISQTGEIRTSRRNGPPTDIPASGFEQDERPCIQIDPPVVQYASENFGDSRGVSTVLPDPSKPTQEAKMHVVQQGDTLYGISRQYYGTCRLWPKILAANPGLDPKHLRVQRRIVVPSTTSAVG